MVIFEKVFSQQLGLHVGGNAFTLVISILSEKRRCVAQRDLIAPETWAYKFRRHLESKEECNLNGHDVCWLSGYLKDFVK